MPEDKETPAEGEGGPRAATPAQAPVTQVVRPRPPDRSRRVRTGAWVAGILVVGCAALLTWQLGMSDEPRSQSAPPADTEPSSVPSTTTTAAPTPTTVPGPTTTAKPVPTPGLLADPAHVGAPYPGSVEGVLTFRGNPSRTYYGEGPVPTNPRIEWAYPDGAMCADSTVGEETKQWCGTGWTGQPAVFERAGTTWVVFGAYDRAVHFLDAATGTDLLAPFPTGDIIKGSVTVDPDGYPIVYSGSRDNKFRALAIDGAQARELWHLPATAVSPRKWNNDWDSTALVLEDYLIEGGENSQFHVVKLNRGFGALGEAVVQPELVFNTPGWDDELLADLAGNRSSDVSIENSVAVHGNTAYFANSGGLVQGWDLAALRDGGTPGRTFRFWTGDDTDASVVVDEEGFLYVAVEYERENARAAEVGQLLKLDPRRPDQPVVWSHHDRDQTPAGFWATPALYEDIVIAPTDSGVVLGLDRATGAERWRLELPGPTWQSPVVVDDVLIQGDCAGVLHAYDVSDTHVAPPELWQVHLGGCVESTPTVWRGAIYVGTRAGRFFKVSDAVDSPEAL